MRQWIAFALIAGLSAPAIAQDRDRSGGDRPMRAERAERAERSERSEAREQRREERREQREMRVQRVAAEPTAVAAPPSGAAEQGRGGHQWGGYWIAREHWGRGFATEAGRQIIEIARTLGLARLDTSYFADNPASGRVPRMMSRRSPLPSAASIASPTSVVKAGPLCASGRPATRPA